MRSGVVQELARVVSAKDSMLVDVPGLREFLVQDDVLGGKLRRLHAEVSRADLRPPTRRRARVRRPRTCGGCPAFIEPRRIGPWGKGVLS